MNKFEQGLNSPEQRETSSESYKRQLKDMLLRQGGREDIGYIKAWSRSVCQPDALGLDFMQARKAEQELFDQALIEANQEGNPVLKRRLLELRGKGIFVGGF